VKQQTQQGKETTRRQATTTSAGRQRGDDSQLSKETQEITGEKSPTHNEIYTTRKNFIDKKSPHKEIYTKKSTHTKREFTDTKSHKSIKKMAPKKPSTADQARPSTHSPTPERDNLEQQIEHLIALNIEQQARQQAFEGRVMAIIDRLAPTPSLTPNPERIFDENENTKHKRMYCRPSLPCFV